MQTVRKFYWRRYCLALWDEIFNLNFPLLDETLRHIELFAKGSSVTYCDIRQNLSNSADPSQSLHIIGYGTLAPPKNNCVPSMYLWRVWKNCATICLAEAGKMMGWGLRVTPWASLQVMTLFNTQTPPAPPPVFIKEKPFLNIGGPDQWERDKLFIVFFKKLLKFSSLFYEKGIGGDI